MEGVGVLEVGQVESAEHSLGFWTGEWQASSLGVTCAGLRNGHQMLSCVPAMQPGSLSSLAPTG